MCPELTPRNDSHLLLTTLILWNMVVNESLPVVTDGVIGGALYAVIISTVLVVTFAEIIPQSICSRYGLRIGAAMAPFVRVLIWLSFPVAWPIAKLLETILGRHTGVLYRRAELCELIALHAAEVGGDLDPDSVAMARGALDLAVKSVGEAMTGIDDVFMLPLDATLDYATLARVVATGHSRIPVYQMVEVGGRGKKKIVGCLLVKSCILFDPASAMPLASIPLNAIPVVSTAELLTNVLNTFQEGGSHMAIVNRPSPPASAEDESAGECDLASASTAISAVPGLRKRFMRKVAEISRPRGSGSDSDSDVEKNGGVIVVPAPTSDTDGPGQARTLTVPLDEPSSGDAHLEPLGIITLEDVLEELIGEEIYDEYDGHGAASFVLREALGPRKVDTLPPGALRGRAHRRVLSDGDAFPALST